MRWILVLLSSLLLWSLAAASTAGAQTRVTVVPVVLEHSARGTPELINDVVRGAVEKLGYRIVGRDEGQADQLLSIKIARVIDDWKVTGVVVDSRTSQVVRRSSEFVEGDGRTLIEEMPDLVARLYDSDAATQASYSSGDVEPL